MRGLWSKLFGRSTNAEAFDQATVYRDLRRRAFSVTAEALHLPEGHRLLGVLMETGLPEAVVTLVAMCDGSASLYFSNGGGIIGAGQHDKPRAAAQNLLVDACEFLGQMEPTCSYPLPRRGNVRFFLVTRDGVLSSEVAEEDLEDEHPLTALYVRAHELITAIREIEETG